MNKEQIFSIPVVYDGKVITNLNKYLVEKQELCYEDVEKIKKLHIFKYLIFKKMLECPEEDLALYNEYVVACEYALQRAWKFPEDENYHRFWNTPRCLCGNVMDNEDAYPTGYYTHTVGCPVHDPKMKEK